MQADLSSLQYFSRNIIDAADVDVEIERILVTARRINMERNVTGALLYSAGCFAQVLEGPLAAVEDIFENIERDRRHRDVTLLHLAPIETRCFARWSMAYAGAGESRSIALDSSDAMESLDSLKISKNGHDLIKVLHETIVKYELG